MKRIGCLSFEIQGITFHVEYEIDENDNITYTNKPFDDDSFELIREDIEKEIR